MKLGYWETCIDSLMKNLKNNKMQHTLSRVNIWHALRVQLECCGTPYRLGTHLDLDWHLATDDNNIGSMA